MNDVELQMLGERAKAGDARSLERLLARTAAFTRAAAHRYAHHAEPDALETCGMLGVTRAVSLWDGERPFGPYLRATIRGHVRRGDRDEPPLVGNRYGHRVEFVPLDEATARTAKRLVHDPRLSDAAWARLDPAPDAAEPLTPRERAVLRAFVAHATVREVADHLGLLKGTVEFHLWSAYRKLGVRKLHLALLRAGLVRVAEGAA